MQRPIKEPKGFGKVNLKPGETERLTIHLNRRAFSCYDVNAKQWTADAGEFTLLVGRSSASTRSSAKLIAKRFEC